MKTIISDSLTNLTPSWTWLFHSWGDYLKQTAIRSLRFCGETIMFEKNTLRRQDEGALCTPWDAVTKLSRHILPEKHENHKLSSLVLPVQANLISTSHTTERRGLVVCSVWWKFCTVYREHCECLGIARKKEDQLYTWQLLSMAFCPLHASCGISRALVWIFSRSARDL